MVEFLSRLDEGILVAFLAVLSGSVIAVTAIVAGNWSRVRRAEIEAALKQDMLARGLSPEDIERVLRASRRKADKKP